MIFSNLKYKNSNFDTKLNKVVNYINENNIKNLSPGTYEIEEKDIFLNIVHYNTKNREDRFWEGHKDYLDFHLIFEGNERIDLAFKDNLEFVDYIKEDDFLSFNGNMEQSLVLKKDDFLILYPEDIHRTCVKSNEESELVKKAIFKIKI